MQKFEEILESFNCPEILVQTRYGLIVIDKETAQKISSGQITDLQVDEFNSIKNIKDRNILDGVHPAGNSLYCVLI